MKKIERKAKNKLRLSTSPKEIAYWFEVGQKRADKLEKQFKEIHRYNEADLYLRLD